MLPGRSWAGFSLCSSEVGCGMGGWGAEWCDPLFHSLRGEMSGDGISLPRCVLTLEGKDTCICPMFN